MDSAIADSEAGRLLEAEKRRETERRRNLAFCCTRIVEELKNGKVIPFLGAGINLYERPEGKTYKDGYLPDGNELTEELEFRFPWEPTGNLQQVSQIAEVMDGGLNEVLYELFGKDYPPASIHSLLARLPKLLRESGYSRGLPLIVTTNYDDVLEAEFRRNGTPFDIVTYVAARGAKKEADHKKQSRRNKFWHLPNAERFSSSLDPGIDDAWQVITRENQHPIQTGERTIVLKIHGSVARSASEKCSFVITEDDYIEYLAQMDFKNPLPVFLAEIIRHSRFLYMGYGLRDWNLRVLIKRIVGAQSRSEQSWAVQRYASVVDTRFWTKRDVLIVESDLKEFVLELEGQINIVRPRLQS